MNIGAGWRKQSENGTDYISLKLDIPFLGTVHLSLFKVQEKKSEKSPDYNVVWNPPRGNDNPPF